MFFRETGTIAGEHICLYTESFKNLAYAFMEAGKLKICRVGWRSGEELLWELSAKSVRWQNSH